MKLLAEYNNQRFEIVEDNPEVGFYLYVYNDNNECISDYLQDSEKTIKEFAFEKFGVPIDNWEEEIIVACCFCGESLSFEKSIQLSMLIDKVGDETQTIYSHKQCLDKVLHKSVTLHPFLLDDKE